jgi:hypothetical protein
MRWSRRRIQIQLMVSDLCTMKFLRMGIGPGFLRAVSLIVVFPVAFFVDSSNLSVFRSGYGPALVRLLQLSKLPSFH